MSVKALLQGAERGNLSLVGSCLHGTFLSVGVLEALQFAPCQTRQQRSGPSPCAGHVRC